MDAFSSVFDRGPSIFTSSQVAEINHKWIVKEMTYLIN